MTLDALATWPVSTLAAAAFSPGVLHATFGNLDQPFVLASVTKPLSAAACLLAFEEGSVDLYEPVTNPGATLADLLAHASGMHPSDATKQLAEPRTRRIYSNAGYETAADLVSAATGIDFADYLAEGVFAPLGMMQSTLHGSAAHAATSTVADLVGFFSSLVTDLLLAPETRSLMTSPHVPSLAGVLPGYGSMNDNVWGLGPEVRGHKQPHWTAATNSPSTWGHFGQAGTFAWWDPEHQLGLVVLTDEPFGPWALDRWPALSAAVVAEFS